MELKYIATRQGRLSSFLREEMKMSAGLMNRLKWRHGLTLLQLGRALSIVAILSARTIVDDFENNFFMGVLCF